MFSLLAKLQSKYPHLIIEFWQVDPTKAAEDIGISSLIFSSKDVETAATARKNIGSTTELDQFPEQVCESIEWVNSEENSTI